MLVQSLNGSWRVGAGDETLDTRGIGSLGIEQSLPQAFRLGRIDVRAILGHVEIAVRSWPWHKLPRLGGFSTALISTER